MERLGRLNVFVSESTYVAMAFAVITLIVLGGVFVLSLRHRQNSLKRSEQILYTGMTLSAYSSLLYSLAYWLGHISAATRDCIVPPYHLSIQEAIFIVADVCLILFVYSMWKFLLYVFRGNRIAGCILAVLEIIVISFTLFCFVAILMIISHYL